MTEIVVIGGGGHARVVVSLLKKIEGYKVLGYVDPVNRGNLLGIPYLGTDGDIPLLRRKHPGLAAAVGVGTTGTNPLRESVVARVTAMGVTWPVIVSPAAVVNEEVSIGEGTVVCDGTVVNCGTRVGRWCILNTNSTVEHDCTLGDHVHISPGAVISGGVEVGEGCFLGAGSSVVHGVRIPAGSVIGAGATVIDTLEVPGTYVGVPAKRIG